METNLEKIMAKISGENVEDYVVKMVDDVDKKQIEFVFQQMFEGLTVLEWNKGVVLNTAWRNSLDKMRDFIFNIPEKNYMVEYLQRAIFDYRHNTMKKLGDSIHTHEYLNCPSEKIQELKTNANNKIRCAIDIISTLIKKDAKPNTRKQNSIQNNRVIERNLVKERDREYERERK